MGDNLEKLIAKRKEQAIKRDIAGKALVIAEKFSAYQRAADWLGYASDSEFSCVFCAKDLKITLTKRLYQNSYDRDLDWWSREYKIDYKGRCVFEEDHFDSRDVIRYRPGVWEKELDGLYFKAIGKLVGEEKRKREAEELRAKKEADKRLKEDFGL